MSINSRDALLDSMKDKASTWGWGAITAFSRARVNNLIAIFLFSMQSFN